MSVTLPDLRRARRLGLLVCRCPDPEPELVALFGRFVVAGAYECRRCRRRYVA